MLNIASSLISLDCCIHCGTARIHTDHYPDHFHCLLVRQHNFHCLLPLFDFDFQFSIDHNVLGKVTVSSYQQNELIFCGYVQETLEPMDFRPIRAGSLKPMDF